MCSCSVHNKGNDDYDSTKDIHMVSVGDIEMEYFTFGDGNKPLVIIPGISVTSVMLSKQAIEQQYSCFKNDYKVYVFDRRKNMPESYSVYDMSDDTYNVLNYLGLKDADICGASQGGSIALCLAAFHPDIVHSICICSSMVKAEDSCIKKFNTMKLYAKEDTPEKLNMYLYSLFFTKEFCDKNKDNIEKAKSIGNKEDLHRFRICVDAQINFDFTENLALVKKPVFIIASKNDSLIDLESTNFLINNLKCNSFLYEKYNHAVYDEAPDFSKRILDYFNSIH